MRLLAFSTAALAALLGAPALAQSPMVGAWEASAETPQGAFQTTLIVAETDEGYDVTFEDPPIPGAPGPMPESEISEVVADGDRFSFKRSLATPQGPFELIYDLTVNGDSFTGTAASSFGPVPFNGTRK